MSIELKPQWPVMQSIVLHNGTSIIPKKMRFRELPDWGTCGGAGRVGCAQRGQGAPHTPHTLPLCITSFGCILYNTQKMSKSVFLTSVHHSSELLNLRSGSWGRQFVAGPT